MADKNLRLQVILEGLDRVTAPLKQITGASATARRDLAETQKQLKALGALQKQVGSYKAKESEFADDTRKYQQAQQNVAALRDQIAATEGPTKKLRAEFEKAERHTAQLAARLDAGGAELQQMSAKLSAAGIDVADLAGHEGRLANRVHDANQALRQQTAQLGKVEQAKRNSDKLNDVSSKATGMGLGMIAAGTAAAVPVVGATKQAMKLESAMADVSKVTNMTAPAIERMSNDFLDMEDRIPMAANELATIAAAAGAAGVGMDKFGKPMRDQREQLLQFTNDAAEMGVAFDMTADVAGETMAKWRTAFELPQAGVVALGDRVNALTNTFGGKAANVTDIITRIGPLGKVAGLAAPQIAALGSTLDSIGIPSEVAATGIKNTMLALTKGEAATKSQVGAYKQLGLEATDVGKRMQKDAAGTIIDVMERIGKLDTDKQSGILTQLFGSESVAAIAPMLTNLDGLKRRLDLVGNADAVAGSMHAEFLNRIATTEGATGLATNALSGLNITMGKALLPTVVKVAEYVKGAASGMRKWAQAHPMLAKGIMIFMGAGAALLILLGGLALGFAAVTAAAAPLAGLLTVSVGVMVGWIAAVMAGIAAVAAAAYLIYENWDGIVAFFTAIWTRLKTAFDGGLWGVMELLWQLGGMLIAGLWTAIKGAVGVLPAIGGALFTALKFVFWNGLMLLPRLFFQFGINTIKGLVDGMMSMFPSIRGIVNKIGTMLPDGVRKLLGIHSPSRVFAEIGGHVMSGLDQGLANNTAAPLSRISQLSGQMTSALAVGAVAPAMALAAPGATGAAASSPATAPTTISNTYQITIQANGGKPDDIEQAVRRAIEQIDRERRGRGFGDE